VRVGSVIRTQLASVAQLNGGPADPSPVLRPALRVWASSPPRASSRPGRRCTTTCTHGEKFGRGGKSAPACSTPTTARFAHGAADLASMDRRFRALKVYGTYDRTRRRRDRGLDPAQVIAWYVLSAWPALAPWP